MVLSRCVFVLEVINNIIMVLAIIDRQSIQVKIGTTLIQVCNSSGFSIPSFCYHPSLQISGNCRMCLVEVLGRPKPVVACAVPVTTAVTIRIKRLQSIKRRIAVIEQLLINHPMDCPICDEAGICDLQEQAILYSTIQTRNHRIKRSVKSKKSSSLTKELLVRCIHCSRCIRFMSTITNNQELAIVNRGSSIQIRQYAANPFKTTILRQEIRNLCPVGFLH
jgi:NADH dehydrogenase/NADH:ubiquinone oxidoreductase subunit G